MLIHVLQKMEIEIKSALMVFSKQVAADTLQTSVRR